MSLRSTIKMIRPHNSFFFVFLFLVQRCLLRRSSMDRTVPFFHRNSSTWKTYPKAFETRTGRRHWQQLSVEITDRRERGGYPVGETGSGHGDPASDNVSTRTAMYTAIFWRLFLLLLSVRPRTPMKRGVVETMPVMLEFLTMPACNDGPLIHSSVSKTPEGLGFFSSPSFFFLGQPEVERFGLERIVNRWFLSLLADGVASQERKRKKEKTPQLTAWR